MLWICDFFLQSSFTWRHLKKEVSYRRKCWRKYRIWIKYWLANFVVYWKIKWVKKEYIYRRTSLFWLGEMSTNLMRMLDKTWTVILTSEAYGVVEKLRVELDFQRLQLHFRRILEFSRKHWRCLNTKLAQKMLLCFVAVTSRILCFHASKGWNRGPCPYFLLEERTLIRIH